MYLTLLKKDVFLRYFADNFFQKKILKPLPMDSSREIASESVVTRRLSFFSQTRIFIRGEEV